MPGCLDLIVWIGEDGVIDRSGCKTWYVDVEPDGIVTPDEDTDYVPVFKPIIYDIILDKDGGTGGNDIIYEHYTHDFHETKTIIRQVLLIDKYSI